MRMGVPKSQTLLRDAGMGRQGLKSPMQMSGGGRKRCGRKSLAGVLH